VYLVTPNNTDTDRYYFKFEDTLDLSIIRELTWAQDQSTMALSEFYGHPFFLVSDEIVSSEFTILGMTKLPNKLVYLPTDRITISDFKLGHPVYLVTPNNTDPDRYYFKFDTIPDSFMNVRMLTNRLTKRRKLLRYFYRQPFYLACNGIVSSKFIINAPKSTGTLNMSSSTTSQTTTMYQTSETITLSNLTPGKPVYLVTPNNADTPSKYYYQVSATNEGSVKANLSVIQSLTLYQSTTTKQFNTFYGQSFYFACNQVVSNQFTITNQKTLTMNPELSTYIPTAKISVSNLTVFRPIYLVTPNNTASDRYYFEFPNTSTITQVDLNTITKFTCANNNTLTMTLSQLEGEPFYFACNSLISPEFKITDSTEATLELDPPTTTTYKYTEPIKLTSSGITGDVFLYNGQNDEYKSASIATITTGQSVSKLITEIGNLTNITLSTLPLSVFTVFTRSAAKFKAGCGTSFTSLFTISPPTAITGFSSSYPIDTTITFPSGFTSNTNYLVVNNSAIYFCETDSSKSITLSSTKELTSLYSSATKLELSTLPADTEFYIAGIDQVSTPFTITEPGTKTITAIASYAYDADIVLNSTGMDSTKTVTLYSPANTTGNYTASLSNFDAMGVSTTSMPTSLSNVPTTVFTLFPTITYFNAGSDGVFTTTSFTISPPTPPITQDNLVVGDPAPTTNYSGTTYLVTSDLTNVYYHSYTTGFTLATDTAFTSLYGGAGKQLDGLYGTSFYIADETHVSQQFSITDGTQSDISSQWKTVFEDNLELTKAGLYNSYHELANVGQEYGDSDNIPLLPISSSQPSPNTPIVFNKIGNTLSFEGAPTSQYSDLGINNGLYYVNIPQASAFQTNSQYIKLNTASTRIVNKTKTINVNIAPGKFTLYDVTSPYLLTATIQSIAISTDSTKTLNVTLINVSYDGKSPTNLKVPYASGSTNGVDNSKNITTGLTSLLNGNTGSNSYAGPPTAEGFIFVLEFENDVTLPAASTNIQVGCQGYASFAFTTTYTYYYGTGTMFINILEGMINFSATISTEPDSILDNHFVISSLADFYSFAPAKSLEEIAYADIKDGQLTNLTGYYPTMILGGDYFITDNTSNPIQLEAQGPSNDADRCRQPWRLSHYVRANSDNNLMTQDPLIKISYNTIAALVYTASKDPEFAKYDPGRLSLYINMWTLLMSAGDAGYGSYSGDMVPPVIALIDAFVLRGVPLEDDIVNFSSKIKALNTNSLVNQDLSNDRSALIAALTSGNMNVYPVISSIVEGGQQLGLGGCGFICTIDFLCRPNFDVMLKYDNILSWKTYDFPYKLPLNLPPSPTYSDEIFLNWIHVYKMAAFRGNGFKTYENWPTPMDPIKNYGDSIGAKAYLTNVRIRDINVTIEGELCFGDNNQGEDDTNNYVLYTATGGTSGKTYVFPYTTPQATDYVYTDFPIYGIPDSGWEALTVEIFSYMGVMFVGMNDYQNFCKWHRMVWHLWFIQNGGFMYNWQNNNDGPKDYITPLNQIESVDIGQGTYWVPSYCVNNEFDEDENWYYNPDNDKNAFHAYSVFRFPPEDFYPLMGPGLDNVDPPGQPITRTDKTITNYWANKWNPYRGDTNSNRVRWSVPSYCMGYSPVWVTGGKTKQTPGWDDNKLNRPIAEALNPMFNNVLGLYTATDGDNNILQAYILASLQWPTKPTALLSETGELTSSAGWTQPVSPHDGDTTDVYGYDCDVSDFYYNTDRENTELANTILKDGSQSGVKYATEKDPTKRWTNNPAVPVNGPPSTASNSAVTDKIGYGITYNKDNESWSYPTQPIAGGTERCTTWAYIAKSIQRTMISQNGLAYHSDNTPKNCGNFPANQPVNGVEQPRYVSLGHDTDPQSLFKLDYIDPRLMQVCEKVTYDAANA